MSGRKEEERNEKIIRGLMKLPPNRGCINCNSLGPQYVCTNFWTFVCMTCSGIHREFTHRVKSVSMAKFTSQEVEALQNGGNQRAREIFLKDWDPQRQRLPNSSNTDKVREFIKNVYVDRRYAEGKTSDKPPRDMQTLRHHEEETRRASSYHSYSQSPPYDYQYEERRYGKQGPALTRKPGSDRGLYEGRISTFSSPSRFSDQMNEDMFANEGSNPRASDYSVSSAGDPFRSDNQSPNFQRDIGFGSPAYQTSRNILNEHLHRTLSEPNAKTKVGTVNHPQVQLFLTASGSFESFDNHSTSVNLVNSVDAVSQPQQSTTKQEKESAIPVSGDFGGLDLFNVPFMPQTASSASTVDLFQLPGAPTTPSADFFQSSSISIMPTVHAQQPSQIIPSSLDLFSEMPLQQPDTTLAQKSRDDVISMNEGWATFDLPHHIPTLGIEDSTALASAIDGDSLRMIDPSLKASTNLHWPAFEDVDANAVLSTSDLWKGVLSNVEVSSNATSSQSWNAFEDPPGQLPLGSIQQSNEEVSKHAASSTLNQYLGVRVSKAS
ncbi:hypothetical protein NMG60_11001137 [Bertholletia excelsa]